MDEANKSETRKDKDINEVFDDILLGEDKIYKESYTEGYRKGLTEDNIEGYHLGYHRGAEFGAELGYYLAISEHFLNDTKRDNSSKIKDNLNKLIRLINEFPKSNSEDVDIFAEGDKIRALFKKICALLKIDAFYPEIIGEYAPIMNSHMVDYFTKNAYESFVPPALRNEIRNVGCHKAIDFILYDDQSKVDMPCLDDFMKKIKRFTLRNKNEICLTVTELEKELNKWGCRNLEGLRLKVFMKPKKSHEVEVLSAIASSLKTMGNITHLVDIGDGKGYLSSLLSLHYKIPVLGIDASVVNTEGAIKRAEKLGRFWKGIVNENKSMLCETERNYANNLLYKQVTQFVTETTDFKELIKTVFMENPAHIGVVGLHTCGNLSPAALRIFINNADIKTLCNVSCCYHLLNEGISESSQEEFGFPMSAFLTNKHYHLGRIARMLSAQSTDRILYEKKLPNRTIFYRAVLEVFLNRYFPTQDSRQVGKCKSTVTEFSQYARRALKRLNLNSENFSDDDLNDFCDSFIPREKELYVFNLMRCMLAPVIESLILIDRLLYLHECGCRNSYLVQLFDPVISPRCYGIIAFKEMGNDM